MSDPVGQRGGVSEPNEPYGEALVKKSIGSFFGTSAIVATIPSLPMREVMRIVVIPFALIGVIFGAIGWGIEAGVSSIKNPTPNVTDGGAGGDTASGGFSGSEKLIPNTSRPSDAPAGGRALRTGSTPGQIPNTIDASLEKVNRKLEELETQENWNPPQEDLNTFLFNVAEEVVSPLNNGEKQVQKDVTEGSRYFGKSDREIYKNFLTHLKARLESERLIAPLDNRRTAAPVAGGGAASSP